MTVKAKPPPALFKKCMKVGVERTVTFKFANDKNIAINNFVVSEFLFFRLCVVQ